MSTVGHPFEPNRVVISVIFRVHATDINEALLAELAKTTGIRTRKLDVLDDAAVSATFADIGPVDVLFNCAGFVHAGSILEMKDADLDFAFNLNVRAMIRTIRAVLPGMLERGDGSIVNMAARFKRPYGIVGIDRKSVV